MAFLDDPLVSYQIGNINSESNCGSFTCKDQLWYLGKTPWELGKLRCCYHQADNDFRKNRFGAHRYRWPFVFSDKLLARWQRLTFGGSFILPFAGAGLMASFSGLNSPLLMKVVVSVAGLHSSRLRKSLWASRIQLLCCGVQLSWYYLVLLGIATLFLWIRE